MGTRDRRIDVYIARAADFAQPILTHLRTMVHEACPDVVETIKWGMPFFERNGKLFAFMAAFTRHAAFGFRRGSLVVGEGRIPAKAMGQFGRLTSVKDLPPRRTFVGYVKRAAALLDAELEGRATPKRAAPRRAAVPADLRAALERNTKARKTFEGLAPSHKRAYVQWIVAAKREETRARRIATAIEWMAEGKTQNWRYER